MYCHYHCIFLYCHCYQLFEYCHCHYLVTYCHCHCRYFNGGGAIAGCVLTTNCAGKIVAAAALTSYYCPTNYCYVYNCRICVLPTMCGQDCGGAAGCDRPGDPLLIA